MTRAIVSALLATSLIAAPVKPKPKQVRSSSAKSANVKPVSTKSVTKSSSARSSSSKTRSRTHARRRAHGPAAPSFQTHPDPERYTQIQQALVARGYFKGPPDGNWNDESTDALKRFQADQKLEPDGKINALTLTGLGLGPKHDGTSAATVPLAAASPSSPQPDPVIPTELPPETAPPATDPQETAPQ
jgi:Putative peptidoglycan binding domain